MSARPRIDAARLGALLDGINAFGRNPATGGFDRPAYSDADMAVRRYFRDTMAADGLAAWIDPVGNVFGRFGPADGPCVMVGSHLDTVADGGAFDGALGCAAALECVRALRHAGAVPDIAVEVVATADEEGRFGGMPGSQALVGALPRERVEAARDTAGVRLVDAMAAQGLDPARVAEAARPPGSVRAFLELHVEQGPVLEAAGVPVGIATAVSGVCVLAVTLEGIANHSGTTPMAMRADAMVGLGEIAAALPRLARGTGTDQSRLTIGRVALAPNAVHTIPGRADFTIVLRDTDRAVMVRLREAVAGLVDGAARRHGRSAALWQTSWLDPVTLDRDLVVLLAGACERRGVAAMTMPSGAGHDAQTMAALCPSGLLFVASRGGISHAPQEHTGAAAIAAGTAALLEALASLSCAA